jgi:hypothetical protein
MKYMLEDFHKIAFSGYEYKLPDSVLLIVNKLISETGIVTNSRPSNESIENTDSRYKTKGNFLNSKKQKKFPKVENIDEMWETAKPFKVTKIEKKEGIDKIINDIRTSLNKISSKNYDAQKESIFGLIDKIMSEEEDDLSITIIANAIFDIASTNKFYSELYAKLYKEMIDKYVVFENNIHTVIDQFKGGVENIKCVDGNVDYDKFCDNNKINDKRKALTSFIVNLMKQNVLEKQQISDIIVYLLDIVFDFVDKEDKTYQIEEITENVYIFVTLSFTDLNDNTSWSDILLKIKDLANYKAKEHLSISSRSIFKYMDILDKIGGTK